MKKICYLLVLFSLLLLFGGCSKAFKTVYGFNEEAYIDDIKIKLVDVRLRENQELEFTFRLTNYRNNTVTISADNNFKFYDINEIELVNQYVNNNSIIKKGDTINYTLRYIVDKKQTYDILFYSGIVENNIKFNITSKDIINFQ